MEKTNIIENNKEDILNLLKELHQEALLKEYLNEKYSEEDRVQFIQQVGKFEKIYPGGIREYIKRASILLENSKNNVNPFAKFTPSIPNGIDMTIGSEEFFKYENIGMEQIEYVGFVLVAGGLGERLGYNETKISILPELITQRTYLQTYIDYIHAYQSRVRKNSNVSDDWNIPLCIMVSDDTNTQTIKLINDNNNFGLKEGQITIVRQEKVPCLLDNDCNLALISDKLVLESKPHGHGDVHTLIHQNGISEKWKNAGKKWIIFFQDTNGLIFNAVPTALGVSKSNNFVVNSICVPRSPGDLVGAICKLTDNETNQNLTLNVEYNQLDSLLRDKWNPLGDVANEKGLSAFPGNINVLVFELNSYNETLIRTKGLMPEFVNPKYSDNTKTTFKSASRLECMMQDYPRLLELNEPVGFTSYPQWFCFSACKNNLKDGIDKLKKKLLPETAFSAETDIFKCNRIILQEVLGKLEIQDGDKEAGFCKVLGVDVYFGAKIIILPSFAVSLNEIKEKIKGNMTLIDSSTLILQGENTYMSNLELDGFLEISNSSTENIVCKNKIRYCYIPLSEGEGKSSELIKGYRLIIKN